VRTSTFVVASLLCLPPAAIAQELPRLDVSTGHALVKTDEHGQYLFLWTAGGTYHVNAWFGVTGEVASSLSGFGLSEDISLTTHSVLGGARFTFHRAQAVAPFVHVLLGPVRARAPTTCARSASLGPTSRVGSAWSSPSVRNQPHRIL
jgi:hypothetical protein